MSRYFLTEILSTHVPDFTLGPQHALIEEQGVLYICDSISTGNCHVQPLVIAKLHEGSVLQTERTLYRVNWKYDDDVG